MAINYIHPQTGESVEKEPYFWTACYSDGTYLDQYELSASGAVFHQSTEIDMAKITELRVYHKDGNGPSFTIDMPTGAKPLVFYRHRIIHEQFKDSNGEEFSREWKRKLWCYGFQQDKRTWIVYADELGNLVFSSDIDLFRDKLSNELESKNG